MKDLRRVICGCALAVALAGNSLAVVAQSAAQNAVEDEAMTPEARQKPMLEEIIVTARRREEALQDTPVAISAFSAEQLTAAGIHTILDLEKNVPGLSISKDGTKEPKFFIRGVGQRSGTTILDPGVGVYLNEVLIPRPTAQLLETVDIENVQVLRGPQGTLFGKNNTGGNILFRSRRPDLREAGGSVSARVGNFGRRDARVAGDIPLIEGEMGLRLALSRTRLEGFLENVLDGEMFGDEDRWGASARFLWELNERFSIDVFGFWSRIDELDQGANCILQDPGGLGTLIFPQQPNFNDACRESEALAPRKKVATNTKRSVFKLDSSMLSLTLDWSIAENLNFKSITGFSLWDNVLVNNDAIGVRADIVANGSLAVAEPLRRSGIPVSDEDRWQITQELQLNGLAFGERLLFTTGVFGSFEKINQHPSGQLIGPQGIGAVPPSFFGFPGEADEFVLPFAEWTGTVSDMQNESVAVFGEISYDLTEWLQLTVGGRYTSERRQRDMLTTEVDTDELEERLGPGVFFMEEVGLFSPMPRDRFEATADEDWILPLTNPVVVKAADRFNEFTPSATLSLLAPERWLGVMKLDSFMTYLTYSEGFKAGGFDARGQELVTVEPEFVTNYEWGFKLDALDNRVRINVAIFSTEWTDMQIQVAELGPAISQTEIFQFLSNVGKATMQGAELESSFTMGNWFVQGTASYIDAEFEEFIGQVVEPGAGEVPVDRSDEPLFMTPEKSFSVSAQYRWHTPIGLVVPRLAFSYRDEVYTGMDVAGPNFESSTIDSIKLWDARLAYHYGEDLRLTAFVDNLTDEFYFHSGFANSDAMGAAIKIQGMRRSYGLEAEWLF